jgi:hypothetical protein
MIAVIHLKHARDGVRTRDDYLSWLLMVYGALNEAINQPEIPGCYINNQAGFNATPRNKLR